MALAELSYDETRNQATQDALVYPGDIPAIARQVDAAVNEQWLTTESHNATTGAYERARAVRSVPFNAMGRLIGDAVIAYYDHHGDRPAPDGIYNSPASHFACARSGLYVALAKKVAYQVADPEHPHHPLWQYFEEANTALYDARLAMQAAKQQKRVRSPLGGPGASAADALCQGWRSNSEEVVDSLLVMGAIHHIRATDTTPTTDALLSMAHNALPKWSSLSLQRRNFMAIFYGPKMAKDIAAEIEATETFPERVRWWSPTLPQYARKQVASFAGCTTESRLLHEPASQLPDPPQTSGNCGGSRRVLAQDAQANERAQAFFERHNFPYGVADGSYGTVDLQLGLAAIEARTSLYADPILLQALRDGAEYVQEARQAG
jgi:hypothetical protein